MAPRIHAGPAFASGARVNAAGTLGATAWTAFDPASVGVPARPADPARLAATWQSVRGATADSARRVRALTDGVDAGMLELGLRLRRTDAVGSVMVVDHRLDFTPQWGWPLRVLTAKGSLGSDVAAELNRGTRAPWLDDFVRFVESGGHPPGSVLDFAFLGEESDIQSLARLRGVSVNALVYDLDPSSHHLWEQVRTLAVQLRTSAIIVPRVAEPAALAGWFENLVEEVSHRRPLDVAVGNASPAGVMINGWAGAVAPLELAHSRIRLTDVREAELEGMRLDGTAERRPPDALPEPASPRYLQARVLRDGVRATEAFRAGARHTARLWIGLPDPDSLVPRTADGKPVAIEGEGLREGAPAEIVVWTEGGDPQHRVVRIGKDRTSDAAEFEVDVPRDAREFTLHVMLVLDGRVAQSGEIRGPVTPGGGRARRVAAGRIDFLAGPELADLGTVSPSVQTDVLTLIAEGDTLYELVPPDDATPEALARRRIVKSGMKELGAHFTRSTSLLYAAQHSSEEDGWLRSEEGAGVFADIAADGFEAYFALVTAFANREPERLRAITDSTLVHLALADGTEDRVPIELLYDRERPGATAVWCDGFDEALATGRCPVCPPWSPDVAVEDPAVCPAGFWGLRKQIERVSHGFVGGDDPEGSIRRSTPDQSLGGLSALQIAVSDNVDKSSQPDGEPTRIMTERIESALGTAPALIHDWGTWRAQIEARRPQLLVVLAHSEVDLLQIGEKSEVRVSGLKSSDVRAPDVRTGGGSASPGPLVLLLGCQTATVSALTSFVGAFRDRGASVVVGTVGKTLGRFAAPIAGEMVALLNDANGPSTVGEAVTLIRRRTMAKGWVTGLLMTVFTDSSYRIVR